MTTKQLTAAFVILATLSCVSPRANAAQCGNGPGGFETWKQQFSGEARAKGIGGTGLSALAGGRFDEAAECFHQMVRLNPRSADGWNNRGWAQLQLGFAPAAVTSFERALAIDPGFERARNNLALARKAL